MDQDLFVLGDDDDEDAEAMPQVGPPPYEGVAQDPKQAREVVNTERQGDDSSEPKGDPPPAKYYLTPSDTLRGIALRFGVNVSKFSLGREVHLIVETLFQGYDLCQLNNLPPSTLTTMPKLLHTRTYILLPSTPKARLPLSTDSAKKE